MAPFLPSVDKYALMEGSSLAIAGLPQWAERGQGGVFILPFVWAFWVITIHTYNLISLKMKRFNLVAQVHTAANLQIF